jgi:hypothetical protein
MLSLLLTFRQAALNSRVNAHSVPSSKSTIVVLLYDLLSSTVLLMGV